MEFLKYLGEITIPPSVMPTALIVFAMYFFAVLFLWAETTMQERKLKALKLTLAETDQLCINLQQDIHEANYLVQTCTASLEDHVPALGDVGRVLLKQVQVSDILMRHQPNTE